MSKEEVEGLFMVAVGVIVIGCSVVSFIVGVMLILNELKK